MHPLHDYLTRQFADRVKAALKSLIEASTVGGASKKTKKDKANA